MATDNLQNALNLRRQVWALIWVLSIKPYKNDTENGPKLRIPINKGKGSPETPSGLGPSQSLCNTGPLTLHKTCFKDLLGGLWVQQSRVISTLT